MDLELEKDKCEGACVFLTPPPPSSDGPVQLTNHHSVTIMQLLSKY